MYSAVQGLDHVVVFSCLLGLLFAFAADAPSLGNSAGVGHRWVRTGLLTLAVAVVAQDFGALVGVGRAAPEDQVSRLGVVLDPDYPPPPRFERVEQRHHRRCQRGVVDIVGLRV